MTWFFDRLPSRRDVCCFTVALFSTVIYVAAVALWWDLRISATPDEPCPDPDAICVTMKNMPFLLILMPHVPLIVCIWALAVIIFDLVSERFDAATKKSKKE